MQFAALAGGAPPELKTIVPAMYATDNRGVLFQDGMFRHETYTAWASMMLPAPDAEGGRSQWQQMLPSLDHHLKGKPLPLPTGLSIYVMGDREWRERESSPVPEETAILYLADLEGCERLRG